MFPTPPRDAVGMLYDSTKCIGCKSCVVACADANGLQPDTRVDSLHQAPNDLNSFTKNIIKLYKPKEGEGGTFAFVKRQCMHCVDPFCVAACPFHALEKSNGQRRGVLDRRQVHRLPLLPARLSLPDSEVRLGRLQRQDREVRVLQRAPGGRARNRPVPTCVHRRQ